MLKEGDERERRSEVKCVVFKWKEMLVDVDKEKVEDSFAGPSDEMKWKETWERNYRLRDLRCRVDK